MLQIGTGMLTRPIAMVNLLLTLPRGSAIARIIGNNAKSLPRFASTVKMWVFEENVNGKKLTEIINSEHENVKYLPGYKLPENVVRFFWLM